MQMSVLNIKHMAWRTLNKKKITALYILSMGIRKGQYLSRRPQEIGMGIQ